ncbi:MAG: efflux RND transporter periplasmic adaptor subunit [Candidatus Rokuibacteriota bacterium]
MRRVVSVIVVAGLVGLGVWGYFYAQSRGSQPKFRTARAERGPLAAAVSATGNLNAVINVQVGSQVSGQIKELLVDFNSVVRKGQLVARIDPEIFEAKVAQAKADVQSAQAMILNQQAQIEKARADVENARGALAEQKALTAKAQVSMLDAKRDRDRKKELFTRELIAKADDDTAQATYDAAIAQLDSGKAKEQALSAGIQSAAAQLKVTQAMLDSARAQVQQKEAALRQAQLDLDHCRITAPVDGVVVSRAVDVGQTVAASLQAPVLFTIAEDLSKMQVETSVDEADIGRLKEGDRATFTVDAYPGRTFAGTVTQMRKAPQIIQNVVTYTVIIAVDNADRRLLPGMTANVKMTVAQKTNVLMVPNAALRFRPPGEAPPGPQPGAGAGAQAGGGGGGGQPSLEQIRERLVKGLSLTEEQQKKLDPILLESREQMQQALQGLSAQERQMRGARTREATRSKIREILTAEQRAKFDESAGGADRRTGLSGRAWIVGPDGKPAAVTLTLGITDGTSTEVLAGNLKEGQEVIVGLTGAVRPGTTGGPRLRL